MYNFNQKGRFMKFSHLSNALLLTLIGYTLFITNNTYSTCCSANQNYIITSTTITQPGTYIVSYDIAGTVTIDADRVYLNLNKKRIDGGNHNIYIASGHKNITIQDGVLNNPAKNGVLANDVTNLTIKNIDFIGGSTAVLINTATCLNFYNIDISQATMGGIAINDSEAIDINQFKAYNNNASETDLFGILLNNSKSAKLANLLITDNSSTNAIFLGILSQNSRDIQVADAHISDNLGSVSAYGVIFMSSEKGTCSNCFVGNHLTTGGASYNLSAGFLCIFNSNDISFTKCKANQLYSTGSAQQTGFGSLASGRIQMRNCVAFDMQGGGGASGFSTFDGNNIFYDQCTSCHHFSNAANSGGYYAENSEKLIYRSCVATDNISTTQDAFGFDIYSCKKVITDNCIATDNSGNNAYGFEFINTSTSCLSNNTAKNNSGTTTARGIHLLDCPSCLVEKNFVADNKGATTSIGIEVSNSGGTGSLTTSIFNNQAQDHTSNFVSSPGSILSVVYNRSTALLSRATMPLDNIDIE